MCTDNVHFCKLGIYHLVFDTERFLFLFETVKM